MNKTVEEKLKEGRTYRNMQVIECRAEEEQKDSYIVEGYATTYNQPYTLYSFDDEVFMEQVDSKAFDNCDMNDVIMQFNHEGKVYARTRNNTLSLSNDEHGLKIRADLSGTEIGRQLYEEIKGGYVDRMSFGFVVSDDEIKKVDSQDDKDCYLRTIKSISKLYDVSAVSIPANDYTEISARSFCEGVIEEAKKEILEKRAKDILKLKIQIKAKAKE